ncbi:MAG: hypothetical protein WCO63_07910 [Bacteroidota bacterium]
MAKKKIVVNYDNLPPGVLTQIEKQYPEGWANHVIKVQGAKDNFFYAIVVDTEEISYLIKVKVKKDRKGIDEDDILQNFEEMTGPEPNINDQEEPEISHED